jgi:hypothetical protein
MKMKLFGGETKTRKLFPPTANSLSLVVGSREKKGDFCESFQSVHLRKSLLDTLRGRGKGRIVIGDSFPLSRKRKTFSLPLRDEKKKRKKNFSNGK